MAMYSLDATEQLIADGMNPESSSMAIVLSSIILSSPQIVFVTARSLLRLLTEVPPTWGLDDHLITVSLFLNLSLAASCLVAAFLANMGHHLLWVQPTKLVIGLKVLYAIDIINVLALSIPKLAILFLYKRLFIISKLTNYAIKCATYAVIVTDIVIILVPVPVVWKLDVPSRIKMGFALEFIIGGLPPKMMETPTRGLVPMTSVKVGTSEADVDKWSSGDEVKVTKMEKVHLG
ncbi:hypothetical protein BPAE_0045g00070 [Botrytis paeoniae]|uniref:Rhodopsin domain-containing protein n=1 Tax=Botrytis paeoniae TaxID=278948 RepID=A0A4Z1FV89_9HELO|nr:hypothetical protein BPAE_0045g00070 [Botrytis paeoniae]